MCHKQALPQTNQTRCLLTRIPRIIIAQAKQPRLPSTPVSIMASGGMAELRAAEQKAAQIVQEARAGKEAWGRGRKKGGRVLSFAWCRLPSVLLLGRTSTPVITHGHMQSWFYLSSICMQASRFCRGLPKCCLVRSWQGCRGRGFVRASSRFGPSVSPASKELVA